MQQPPKNAHIKPVISVTNTDIGSQQVHFDNKEFFDFIQDKGYKCHIERSMQCPCRISGAGSALSECQNCGGTGWFYIQKTETYVTCTNMNNISKYIPWTKENVGTVSISYRPVDKLGFMDKVTLLELQSWFSHTKKVILNNAGDKLFFFTTYPIIQVFDLYWYAGAENPLSPISPDQYTISGNKILLDFATFKPIYDANEGNLAITLRYTHNPAFLVIDVNRDLMKQPENLGDTKKNLPLHAIGRVLHYVMDEANLGNESLFDNTDYSKPSQNYDV